MYLLLYCSIVPLCADLCLDADVHDTVPEHETECENYLSMCLENI